MVAVVKGEKGLEKVLVLGLENREKGGKELRRKRE